MTVEALIQLLLDRIKTGTLRPDTPVLTYDLYAIAESDPRVTRELTAAEVEALEDTFKPVEFMGSFTVSPITPGRYTAAGDGRDALLLG